MNARLALVYSTRVGLGVCGQYSTGQNHAFAAYAAVIADVTAQFIGAGGVEFALPGHADFAGVVPEIAEYAATTHVHVVLNHRVAHVGEVGYEYLIAQ